jgi:hypothetical protein
VSATDYMAALLDHGAERLAAERRRDPQPGARA